MFHRHTKAGTICRPVSGGMIPAVLLFHYFFLRLSALYANGPKRAVAANRQDHSFHSGTDLSALSIYFVHVADLIGLEFQPGGQERFNVKSVLVACVGCVFEIGMLGDVILVREERPHTAQLEDTLAAVHNGQLVLAHQLFVPINAKRKGQADQVVEFIKSDSPLADGIEKTYAVLKETEKRKYLPSEIVALMKEKGYDKFSINKHTELWKARNAKNPKFNYGVLISKTWYWYETWLKEVEKHCEENRDELKS